MSIQYVFFFYHRDNKYSRDVFCYSFDVRGKHLSEARHWSAPEVFGPRAHFATSPPPAALLVRDVKRRDEGVYRCRVDFRNTQTTSFRYNLTVVGKYSYLHFIILIHTLLKYTRSYPLRRSRCVAVYVVEDASTLQKKRHVEFIIFM